MKSIYPGYMMLHGLDCHADVIWYADFRSRFHSDQTAVLIIVFIESMGMFLALGE